MNSDFRRRMLVLVTGLLGCLAFSSASAYAVGPPILSKVVLKPSLTSVQIESGINPNGRTTHYKFEYGPTEALGSSTQEYLLPGGSGYSEVKVKEEIAGLAPGGSPYFIRLVAWQKTETVYSPISHMTTGEWYIPTGQIREGSFPALIGAYENEKSFSIKLNSTEWNKEIVCNSWDSGSLSNVAAQASYHIAPTSCVVYSSGVKECSAKVPAPIELDGTLSLSSHVIVVESTETCFFGKHVEFPVSQGFSISAGKEAAVSIPVTLTGKSEWGSIPITITETSTWAMSGVADKGLKFGLAEGSAS
jgi:hypothetical protein